MFNDVEETSIERDLGAANRHVQLLQGKLEFKFVFKSLSLVESIQSYSTFIHLQELEIEALTKRKYSILTLSSTSKEFEKLNLFLLTSYRSLFSHQATRASSEKSKTNSAK